MLEEGPVIVSVLVRRLKRGNPSRTSSRAREADQGFGVATRVLNAQSLDDARDVISIGFVTLAPDELQRASPGRARPRPSGTTGSTR
jgi:hypothetical protein